MSSFKSSENIQKKEDGPDRSVSDNQSSSVTLNELAMKARKINYRATGGVSIKVRKCFQANYNLMKYIVFPIINFAIVNTIINVFTLAKVSPNKLHKNA